MPKEKRVDNESTRSEFSWPCDRQWVFVDALTTTTAANIAGEVSGTIVTGVSRLARICCAVGSPHIVVGECDESPALLGSTLMAPAASLSRQWSACTSEIFDLAWADGCSCSWLVSWEQFALSGLPPQLGELLSLRMPQVLLDGGADLPRLSAIAEALRSVSSRLWVVSDLVRREFLHVQALTEIQFATVERAYADWLANRSGS